MKLTTILILLIFRGELIKEGRLLERGAYVENLMFWRGAYKRVGAH